jgi:hypothetical protein
MTTRFVNLTPHALNVLRIDGTTVDLPPSGEVARVGTSRVQTGEAEGIGLFTTTFGAVTGLPPGGAAPPGTGYIVSGIVAGHPSVRDRVDVFSPGELVRDAAGQPIGCRGLTRTAG